MNSKSIAVSEERLLITGSNGFIGAKVVEHLLEYGFTNLRCFVRPSSKLENLKKVLDQHSDAKTVDIGLRGSAFPRRLSKRLSQDVSVIIHLAAGFDKSFAGAFMNSALTTRNLMDAFLEVGSQNGL